MVGQSSRGRGVQRGVWFWCAPFLEQRAVKKDRCPSWLQTLFRLCRRREFLRSPLTTPKIRGGKRVRISQKIEIPSFLGGRSDRESPNPIVSGSAFSCSGLAGTGRYRATNFLPLGGSSTRNHWPSVFSSSWEGVSGRTSIGPTSILGSGVYSRMRFLAMVAASRSISNVSAP